MTLLAGTAFTLVQYTARSRRLAEMQFRFAAGISHDLRTPLTAIRGAAYNLYAGLVRSPQAIEKYLHLILRNAEDLTLMIENVLAFSVGHHGGNGSEKIAVGDLVRNAAEALSPEIEQADCRLDLDIAPNLPELRGDPVAVGMAIRNLIGNALRHGGSGKWIGIAVATAEKNLEVRISDRGPGVAAAERGRIFEPFYRSERTRAGRIPGTGLGLSLVKATVERYQGSVEVTEAPGGGAQFIMRFRAEP
jgi:signal transduction histidine kinase